MKTKIMTTCHISRVEIYEKDLWLKGLKFYNLANKLVFEVGNFSFCNIFEEQLGLDERIIGIRSQKLAVKRNDDWPETRHYFT